MSPFRALYGCDPLDVPDDVPASSKVRAVNEELQRCRDIFDLVQKKLKQTQVKMKKAAYKYRWALPMKWEIKFWQGTLKSNLHHKLGQ